MKQQTTSNAGSAAEGADDSSEKRNPGSNRSQADSPAEDPPRVYGEGNYEAARRYDKGVEEFGKSHDVEKLAREAAPKSPWDAQKMREAEEEGRRHAHGEDPAIRQRNATTPDNPDTTGE